MKTKVIAEAGINHNGSLEKALRYIDAAAESGADYIKFHHAISKEMINLDEKRIAWNDKHDANIEPIDRFVERMELSSKELSILKSHSAKKNIGFMLSVYDRVSAEEALDIGINNIKLASCDFIKKDLINFLYQHVDNLVLATGMVDSSELEQAKDYIDPKKTSVLHCVSLYPTPYKLANLKFIETLKTFGWKSGYSDHTKGIGMCVLSLEFNPYYIEKHFYLEEDEECADKSVSCLPRELKELCEIIKFHNEIYGDGHKNISKAEADNRNKFRNRWK